MAIKLGSKEARRIREIDLMMRENLEMSRRFYEDRSKSAHEIKKRAAERMTRAIIEDLEEGV